MRNYLLVWVCILVSLHSGHSQAKHSFVLGKNDFLLDGDPFQIISGELHPSRIPFEYWGHRIKMVKAMGCNTIAVYVMWNYHETSEGVFDFKNDNHDIAAFIRICQEEKMYVLLRPGPYVCAEWDFGGIPPYLLKIPDIKIRCMDPRYIRPVFRYVERLAEEIRPLQITHGGPVLMLQIENEYGSYGNDKTYIRELRRFWEQNGIDVPFYTADGPTDYMLEAGSLPGMAIGLDSGSGLEDFQLASRHYPDVPVFSSETYPGWLTHWGEKWARPDTLALRNEIEFLLKNKKSFNLYVAHGGTNFGFTAGANAFSPTRFQPDITSYDYDAPIDEQGNPTPKYFMLRRLIAGYTGAVLPDIPAPIEAIRIENISLKPVGSFRDITGRPIHTPQPESMENFRQNQGLILYKTRLRGHKKGKLVITEPHDYALVFLDGVFVDTVFRDGGNWTVDLPGTDSREPILEILVEGMGHINFAQYMIDRKGITDRVTLNGMTLMAWETYLMPFDEKMIAGLKLGRTRSEDKNGTFFKGEFELDETGDTYFDMSGYVKGYLYINGHHLGRYWNRGPQQRLYCPASWLKKGKNEIIVFDLHECEARKIGSEKKLY